MDVRPLRPDEVPTFVDDLWLPFATEMGNLDEHDALAGDEYVRVNALAYRQAQLADEDVQTFVAEADGSQTGYTTVSYSESPPVFARGATAKVTELYVEPDARGSGLGTALLERAHEWGERRGCEHAALSVHARNETAQACYEAAGYETRYLKMDRQL
ncbi:GNAT family N-acetyltransferase [Haloferax larsenii]|uniref:Acetyltransferase (GNAT) family protein n=1 Tax=Haloferax larsenii TaxID=302484 RepID=A0A1H7R5M0_HALLR|nr:GNAT family N-acetyltransferase [Haloferax larsenii]SEL54827.1 Acetyltransferase (GNAT) family protein [Haloferax larsenii]